MTQTPMTSAQRVTIRGIADAIPVLPYLLGYVPEAPSIVAMFHDGAGALVLTTRVDYPVSGDTREREDYLDAVAMITQVATVEGRAVAAVLVGFDAEDAPGASGRSLTAMRRVLTRAGVNILGIGQVCAGRWRENLGGLWEAVSDVPSAWQVALTVDGVAPDRSRGDFAARLLPGLAASRAAGQVGMARRLDWPGQVGALVRVLSHDGPPRPRQAAAAALAFTESDRRDVLLGLIVPGLVATDVLDADLVAQAGPVVAGLPWLPDAPGRVGVERAAQLVRAVPVSLAAGPLLLTALLAWHTGNGMQAGEALARVGQVDPGNVLAGLLAPVVAAGVRFEQVSRSVGSGSARVVAGEGVAR